MSSGGDEEAGRSRRAPPLSGELTVAIAELRQARADMRALNRAEQARLRELLPRVIAAGYSHRAAGALLGVAYGTVMTIMRRRRE